MVYLYTFKTKSSSWIDDDVIVSGSKLNLILVGKIVDRKVVFQVVDVYIYDNFHNDILREKINAVLNKTGALFVIVDRGTDNSDAVHGLQLYCNFHLIANMLDLIGSTELHLPEGTTFSINELYYTVLPKLIHEFKDEKIKIAHETFVALWDDINDNTLFNKSKDAKKKISNFITVFCQSKLLEGKVEALKADQSTQERKKIPPHDFLKIEAFLTMLISLKIITNIMLKDKLSEENLEKFNEALESLRNSAGKNFQAITQMRFVHKIYGKILRDYKVQVAFSLLTIRPLYQVHGDVHSDSLQDLPNLEVNFRCWMC